MTERLRGKRIIVIGSASGIGAATVRRLVEEGARVCAADINLAGVEKLATELGDSVVAVHVDITDEASVNAAVEKAVEGLGGLDGAHVNAADLRVIHRDSDAVDLDLAVFDQTIAVNLRGHLLCARAAIPHLLANKGGAIVFTSSGSARGGEPQRPCYAMSKGGLEALSRHIASRWGREGITSNILAPGFTMTQEMQAGGQVPQEVIDHFLKNGRSFRLGQSEDQAAVAALLLSDDARWINGQVINVNGGSMFF